MKKLVLKSGRERSLINRHPWVFSGAVKEMPKASNGEVVQIVTNHNDIMGYGFYSPNSQITCRVFEFTPDVVELDADYWHSKFVNAFALRQRLLHFEHTNCFRLLHAEGDFFPGIIVDVYNNVAVVQVLVKGVEQIANYVFSSLNQLGFNHIYVKTKQTTQLLENVEQSSRWIGAPVLMPLQVLEHGVKFFVDVEKGQKTGFFIDQRENRKTLGEYAAGKTVLNTFSYSAGFSLYALAGGASVVHSVDSSKDAIAMGEANVALGKYKGTHQSFVVDCFEFLSSAQPDFYDIIILDPPAFAKNARSVDNAARGYKNLNLSGFQKIKSGGLIFTFSCSQHINKDLFRKIVFSAAADSKRNVRVLKQLSQPEDHPINIYHPEGEYLKGLLLMVD